MSPNQPWMRQPKVSLPNQRLPQQPHPQRPPKRLIEPTYQPTSAQVMTRMKRKTRLQSRALAASSWRTIVLRALARRRKRAKSVPRRRRDRNAANDGAEAAAAPAAPRAKRPSAVIHVVIAPSAGMPLKSPLLNPKSPPLNQNLQSHPQTCTSPHISAPNSSKWKPPIRRNWRIPPPHYNAPPGKPSRKPSTGPSTASIPKH
mmetsp:Transcript_5373/g.6146  ORF Transcript_5373/g.6146 Transcript_5373/m.6146 type:complete len:202 (+) Transcript_5373:223-828(+)